MATFSDARAVYGLSATGTPTSTNVSGTVQVGVGQTQARLTTADAAYSVSALIAEGSDFVIDLTTGSTSGSDTWVAGTAQVETATAAGSITGSGNASVVVTAAGMNNSPKTISVAVTNGDTAATWAGKVRTALAADTDVSTTFTVGGSTTSITLTRKAATGLTFAGTSIPEYYANDGTLNISLDNGTCTGITTAATSANTTAGVATSGANILDGDGKDFEGVALPTLARVLGVMIEQTQGITTYANGDDTERGKIYTAVAGNSSIRQIVSMDTTNGDVFGSVDYATTFTATDGFSIITLTVTGTAS